MEQAEQQQAQRDYYARTAAAYDGLHAAGLGEHDFALAWLSGIIDLLGAESLLDVGSGTGRALLTLKQRHPGLALVGVEPSAEMRAVGHGKGLAANELVEGNATDLRYPDESFDFVTEFGVLHHLPDPSRAIAEMLRVARIGVFISDSNNFGQGGPFARTVKQWLNRAGLWKAFDWLRTGGKGYHWSEGDGLFYSYSVFSDYRLIESQCASVHVLNTQGSGISPYKSAHTVALLGLKRPLLGSN
jgi:ubiquinone/menaquinone biosynthesis C-methylase UbiE